VALLDVADPAVRRAHLRGDGELRSTLRTYYGARSAMLLQFWFILFGLAGGALLVRKAFLGEGGIHWALVAAGVAWAVALPTGSAFVGARLVHRFSKSCRKKPLRADELRVVSRSSQSPAA
jgi:hypothetical protein